MSEYAEGSPTKEFFISMLTRDIALHDAILDLLDNCLDGVVRKKGASGKGNNREYYKGFEAKITIANDSFEIKDNCGGIPRDIAEQKAFRMGGITVTNNLPTVGIYGIGMKRAIFKMGKEATVVSKHNNNAFSVKIPEDWVDNSAWNFPISDNPETVLNEDGTHIRITKLTEDVSFQWRNGQIDGFVNDLVATIKSSYSLIIEKGFSISVNNISINALPVQLLMSDEKTGIKPYMFTKEYDDVKVRLAVGFYAPPPTDDELDESSESKRTSSDAGWTVVCNDRVILYNDKSHLTGWGESGIPRYHMQFIGIRGMVTFESNKPEKLPMTTTKRGIDLSSQIYADIKNQMRVGLKLFTSYTNQWKGRNEQERKYSKSANKVPYHLLFEDKQIKFKKKDGGSVFNPDLPVPPNDKDYQIIRFSKPKEEIEAVRNFFYKDSSIAIDVSPSKIGEQCFDHILKEKISV
ncbi:MAG: ATP-binding protein [Helicobacteraceae bacterium]|jgi:hypothetical protein|nr:ATP-binding protein [Helicobacteraceae bacterium]